MTRNRMPPQPEGGKVLLLSVGGTAAPIVKAVLTARPRLVGIFSSAESQQDWSQSILPELKRQGWEGAKECVENLRAGEENDLRACLDASRRLLRKTKACTDPADSLVIAFTGGTKPMTAGLVLACQFERARYLYIGGARDKEGKGIVQGGTEKAIWLNAVLDLRARQDLDLSLRLYRERAFDAALKILRRLIKDIKDMHDPVPLEVEALADLCEGYLFWDRLNWNRARRAFQEGIEKMKHIRCPQFSELERIGSREAKEAVGEAIKHLDGLTRAPKEGVTFLLREISLNAERRRRLERYDDALLRYYRYLELVAQGAVRRALQADTSEVPLASLPPALQEEYRFAPELFMKEQKAYLRLAMVRSFELLDKLEQKEGRVFMKNLERLRSLTDKRNQSILAHGCEPIPERVVDDLASLIKDLFGSPKPIAYVDL
jgi:CRISPR-associated protein (TIGR02710 family)